MTIAIGGEFSIIIEREGNRTEGADYYRETPESGGQMSAPSSARGAGRQPRPAPRKGRAPARAQEARRHASTRGAGAGFSLHPQRGGGPRVKRRPHTPHGDQQRNSTTHASEARLQTARNASAIVPHGSALRTFRMGTRASVASEGLLEVISRAMYVSL